MIKPYYESGGITIYHGDCREVLPHINPCETCITDPPYGLQFMGKDWDRGVPGVEFWRLIMVALKPGAACLAFGGTRTWHRLACAIEDAGFEIRDCLMWLYGSGFPKSLDISKAIDKATGAEREIMGTRASYRPKANEMRDPKGFQDRSDGKLTAPATDAAKLWNGWGTALKPSWEPVILAMKPIEGTFAENAIKHGVAGLNVEGGRIEGTKPDTTRGAGGQHGRYGHIGAQGRIEDDGRGRFPANLILAQEAARMLDVQSGEHPTCKPSQIGMGREGNHSKGIYGAKGSKITTAYGDFGGASRFFYTAKASDSERNDGYDVRNTHPTVKPLDLMRYLCTLTATPIGGAVLDPFMGSGSTLVAARACSRPAVGIEIEEKYCEIAVRRLAQEVLFHE